MPPTSSLPRSSRRDFLVAAAAGIASMPAVARVGSPIQAIAFDAFVLFNPRRVVTLASEIAGGNGEALVAAASAKLFAYTWFYTSSRKYAGFDELATDAFRAAARMQGVVLSAAAFDRIVEGYANLEIWPDVPAALDELAGARIRLAMLSNLSVEALRHNLHSNGIEKRFDFVLSTDEVRQFKPAPRAYELGARAFHLPVKRIGFAASAGWDAAGATWFGYPSVWVNRAKAPPEDAHVSPLMVSTGMEGVLRLART